MTDAPTEREDDGTWAKLRRRKVVQWGVAYVAGCWVLLQGLGYLGSTFDLPRQIQQLVTIALLVGVPVVLTLAWYHGDKGEQRVSRAELAVLTLLLFIGGGVLWLYGHRSAPPPQASASSGAAPAAMPATVAGDTRPSVAVLPFENRSDQEKDAYFVDGIHDDILTQLSKVSALKVISRTSVEQFRDTKLPTRAIAEQLGVNSILEGGVQRAGDRVRINVQLIDAGTDAHLWAESYDRELTAANIFAIQSEVAAAIAGALKAALTPAEKDRAKAIPTGSLAAWESYQLGRQRQAKRTSEAMAEALGYFEKAIELDPKFALAYVGVAEALWLQVGYSGAPGAEKYARADQAVAMALELDPGLGEAWTSAANIADAREQFDRAGEMYRRAIELNPNYAAARQWYGEFLRAHGRREEAIAELKAALALDPLSPIVNTSLGDALRAVGRAEEADLSYRKAIEIDPAFAPAYFFLGASQFWDYGRLADGLPFVEMAVKLDPGRPMYVNWLVLGYLDIGDEARAAQLANESRRRWPKDAFSNVAPCLLSLQRGERESAVECLHAAVELDGRNDAAVILLGGLCLERGDIPAALGIYRKAYPELFGSAEPSVDAYNLWRAVQVAAVLLASGDREQAGVLLERGTAVIRDLPRMSGDYRMIEVSIHALQGEKQQALASLREAEKAGWRGQFWRYYRDLDPTLASIRNEPGFKAVFADIERDMARQRAVMAARPKDAPLDLGVRSR